MSAADSKPCPYCGETIRANAIKCRFCGEFLEDELPDEGQDDGGLMAWLFPMGNNFLAMLAGYFGILALIPAPLLGWAYSVAMYPNDAVSARLTLTVCSGVSGLLGVTAIILGIIGLLQVLQRDQPGLGRAAFGIGAGLIGGLLYPALFLLWFIPTFLPK
jgi:hypothetical protein